MEMWGFKQILHLSCSSRLKLRNQAHGRLHLKPKLLKKIFLVSVLFKLFTSVYFFSSRACLCVCLALIGVFPQALRGNVLCIWRIQPSDQNASPCGSKGPERIQRLALKTSEESSYICLRGRLGMKSTKRILKRS